MSGSSEQRSVGWKLYGILEVSEVRFRRYYMIGAVPGRCLHAHAHDAVNSTARHDQGNALKTGYRKKGRHDRLFVGILLDAAPGLAAVPELIIFSQSVSPHSF